MSRMTGSWLSGSSGSSAALPRGVDGPENLYRGQRLGLPRDGAGSVAGTGRRGVAIVLDWALASLVAFAFTAPDAPGTWQLWAWMILGAISVALFAATPGQLVAGIGIARVDAEVSVGVLRAVGRVALIALVVPVLIWDLDGRGLQDRLTSTVVLRFR